MNVIERDTEPSYFYTWPHFIRGNIKDQINKIIIRDLIIILIKYELVYFSFIPFRAGELI